MATSILDNGQALIVGSRSRKIKNIIPHVTIEETLEDNLEITQHPVEKGAAISDHAYLRPVVVDMKIGFSDSTAKFTFGSVVEYENLLALQAMREPFDVFTGKRVLSNMLVKGISVTTDQRTEFAVMATVRLQEIRTASVNIILARSSNPLSALFPQTTVAPQSTQPILPQLVTNPPAFAFSLVQEAAALAAETPPI